MQSIAAREQCKALHTDVALQRLPPCQAPHPRTPPKKNKKNSIPLHPKKNKNANGCCWFIGRS